MQFVTRAPEERWRLIQFWVGELQGSEVSMWDSAAPNSWSLLKHVLAVLLKVLPRSFCLGPLVSSQLSQDCWPLSCSAEINSSNSFTAKFTLISVLICIYIGCASPVLPRPAFAAYLNLASMDLLFQAAGQTDPLFMMLPSRDAFSLWKPWLHR